MDVKDAVKIIIPPDSDDTKKLRIWRWGIAIFVIALIADSMAGRGLIKDVGAYANKDDVQTILELQLAEEMRHLHQQMCALPVSERGPLTRVIDDYERRYRELTGHTYPLPNCNVYDS